MSDNDLKKQKKFASLIFWQWRTAGKFTNQLYKFHRWLDPKLPSQTRALSLWKIGRNENSSREIVNNNVTGYSYSEGDHFINWEKSSIIQRTILKWDFWLTFFFSQLAEPITELLGFEHKGANAILAWIT